MWYTPYLHTYPNTCQCKTQVKSTEPQVMKNTHIRVQPSNNKQHIPISPHLLSHSLPTEHNLKKSKKIQPNPLIHTHTHTPPYPTPTQPPPPPPPAHLNPNKTLYLLPPLLMVSLPPPPLPPLSSSLPSSLPLSLFSPKRHGGHRLRPAHAQERVRARHVRRRYRGRGRPGRRHHHTANSRRPRRNRGHNH